MKTNGCAAGRGSPILIPVKGSTCWNYYVSFPLNAHICFLKHQLPVTSMQGGGGIVWIARQLVQVLEGRFTEGNRELHQAAGSCIKQQVAAGCCRLLQVATDCCRQLQEAAGRCIQLQLAAGSYRQLHVASGSCRNLQAVAGSCRQLQVAVGSWRKLQVAAGSCRQLLVVGGSCRQLPEATMQTDQECARNCSKLD